MDGLPENVLTEMVSFLDFEALVHLRATNHSWKQRCGIELKAMHDTVVTEKVGYQIDSMEKEGIPYQCATLLETTECTFASFQDYALDVPLCLTPLQDPKDMEHAKELLRTRGVISEADFDNSESKTNHSDGNSSTDDRWQVKVETMRQLSVNQAMEILTAFGEEVVDGEFLANFSRLKQQAFCLFLFAQRTRNGIQYTSYESVNTASPAKSCEKQGLVWFQTDDGDRPRSISLGLLYSNLYLVTF
ncbi:expressed unknown protein [Seminavis robusta]|uniref:F-box domain-containing protein n=1 Tax=Seminavis robusta TaxID=568900 RepID=A0A9N8DPU2_9STRA|nr:expressed unknown protein [Seminavis robusta]|eukprot:Sro285_g108090.1 n/a (246) ;mRNA; f:11790-12527